MAFSDRFVWERGTEVVARLEAVEMPLAPGERLPRRKTPEELTELVEQGVPFDPRWTARTLGEWVARHGWVVRQRTPEGIERAVSLEAWRSRDPDATLLRIHFHSVARWLSEKRQALGHDPFSHPRSSA